MLVELVKHLIRLLLPGMQGLERLTFCQNLGPFHRESYGNLVCDQDVLGFHLDDVICVWVLRIVSKHIVKLNFPIFTV